MAKPGKVPLPLAERFWPKVKVGPDNECWEWQACVGTHGYGAILVGSLSDGSRTMVPAHRVSYELTKGPIPDGLEIDHLCRNRLCVNPNHLEAVTHHENGRRGLRGAALTHCPHGHPYNEENTYITKAGHRQCNVCRHRHRMNRRRQQ